jgi:hypothetical protein
MPEGFRVEVAAVPGWTICLSDTPCRQCPAPCKRFIDSSADDAARAAELAGRLAEELATSDRRKQ